MPANIDITQEIPSGDDDSETNQQYQSSSVTVEGKRIITAGVLVCFDV